MERAAISLDYLAVSITADVTLDAQVVTLALMAEGSGSPTDDWITATWIGDTGTTRTARILVGPGGDFVPSVGAYAIWWRVTDDPSIPASRLTEWVTFY